MQGERQRRKMLKARLLAGAALVAAAPLALADVAAAQDAVPAADGLTPEAVYLEADSATRDGDVITAQATPDGDRVLARARGHTLRAREVTYDLAGGVATATGEVELTTPNGEVAYASHLETQPDFDIGVAVDFATRLQNGASLMAATAVRRSERVNQLNYALFTPCPICDADGKPKTPSIAIQAEQVTQSEELRAILYRNAVFRVGGVPVLYLPFFSHPDPSVDRASGFLVPTVNYDEGRGLSVETPYLFVVSPSEDWLVSPQFNTRVAPLLNFQWRRRFETGTIIARGGYTYERNFGDFDLDGDGEAESNVAYGDRDHRGYLLASGRFDPDGPWRWGFTAERTSDKTLFDRYDVVDPYQENGLYYGDQRRLISQIYAERQTDRSYLSVAAFTFQSLRLDPAFADTDFRDPDGFKVFEEDDTLPVVGPLVDLRLELPQAVFGGRLRLSGLAVSLYRADYIGAPVLRPEAVPADPTGLGGIDSRRVSFDVDWRRAFITGGGFRIEPFLDGRGDAYSLGDLPPALAGDSDDILTRGRLTAGVDVSYPLIRRLADGGDLILEPMAQLSISTRSSLDPRIPIEDSQAIELDAASLFATDRFPGYDLYEGGARFTAGGRATYRWGEGRSASLFVGRSWRDNDEPAFLVPIPDAPTRFYDPTGLASELSDWVVQGEIHPADRIRAWGHATVDGEGELQRAEVVIDAGWGRRNLASLAYLIDRSNPVEGPLDRGYQFVELSGQQFVYGPWGFTVAGVADLERGEITRSEVGLLFDDDCFRFEIGYRRDNTRVRPTGPSEGVYVRLNLATFGGSGYGRDGLR